MRFARMNRSKRYLIHLVVGIVLVSASSGWGQDTPDIPAGMELRRVNDVNLVVPRGVRIIERDSLLIIEPLETYVARRLAEMEARVEQLSQQWEEMKRRAAAQDRPRATEDP